MKFPTHAFYYDLFTSGYRTQKHLLIRRLILLNAFLIIGSIAFILFFILNLIVSEAHGIALLDLIAATLFVIALFDLRRRHREQQTIAFTTIVLSSFMLIFTEINQNQHFGLIWTIFVPIFVICLYGHNKGLRIVGVYYLLLFTIGYLGLDHWSNSDWTAIALSRFVIASAVLVFVVYMTEYAFDKLQNDLNLLSTTDPLTRLFNRRRIHEILDGEINRLQRYGTPLVLVIVDIDDFKTINDTFGHAAGDTVLLHYGALLQQSVREVDTVGRWGGEEFIILFPGTTLDEALFSLERIRQTLRSTVFEPVGCVKSSFGLCVAETDAAAHDLLSCADRALYDAKSSGKDTIRTRSLSHK
jgi:diguanylate cyclase (GGDEF)-like protein